MACNKNVQELATDIAAKADASVTIASGNGLTGGGDLSANRTLAVGAGSGIAVAADAVSVDINGLTAEATIDQAADYVMVYDASAGALRKALVANAVYSSGSFTATLTGCTTSPTGSVSYQRTGSQVTLNIPTITGTSNTTAATLTGMPASLAPSLQQRVLVIMTDNGTITTGTALIGTDGTMTLQKDVSGAAFTASGTKGPRLTSVAYVI